MLVIVRKHLIDLAFDLAKLWLLAKNILGMDAVEGVSNMKENWTTRATGKTKSVVQTLFNRQLGLPHFSRHGGTTDCDSVRQMFNSRSPSDEKGKPVKAAKIELKPGKSLYGNRNKGGPTWTQLDIPDKTEIDIIDTKIWIRWKARNQKDKEALYLIEPSPLHGLKFTQPVHSAGNGKIIAKYVMWARSLSNDRSSVYFLTLIEPGILRAYDLVKKEIIQELALPSSISPGIKGYTDMAILDNSKKIFLMGTQKNLTKVIIVLGHPPWNEIGIIHVDIPVKIDFNEGVCFLQKGKCVEMTTWPFLFKAVDKDPPSSRVIIDDPDPRYQVICKREGRLKEFPTILSKLRGLTDNFGVIDMGIPLFYGGFKTGKKFYDLFNLDSDPAYEIAAMEQHETLKVFQLPSATSKVLITSYYSGQSQTVEFKSEWNQRKNQKSLQGTALPQAFNYWEKSGANSRPSITTAVVERRPRRSCVSSNEKPSKIPILGIAYCSILDLLAVLTADEDEFQVAIYDTLKLQLVKALPPVLAWPPVKGSGDVNPKRSSLKNVEFDFEAEFITVVFHYTAVSRCKPQVEVFFTRLLSESF